MKKLKLLGLLFVIAMCIAVTTIASKKVETMTKQVPTPEMQMPGYTATVSTVVTAGDNTYSSVAPVFEKGDLVMLSSDVGWTVKNSTNETMVVVNNSETCIAQFEMLMTNDVKAITEAKAMMMVNDTGQLLDKAQMLTANLNDGTNPCSFDGKMRTGQYQILKHPMFSVTNVV